MATYACRGTVQMTATRPQARRKATLAALATVVGLATVSAWAGDMRPTANATTGTGTQASASLNVNLRVEPYAEISWGDDGLDLIVLSAAEGRVKDKNWRQTTFSLASNCSVRVAIYESMGQWIVDQFASRYGSGVGDAVMCGVYGQGYYGLFPGTEMYGPRVALFSTNRTLSAPSWDGPKFMETGDSGEWVPDGTAVGGMRSMRFVYGGSPLSVGPDGPADLPGKGYAYYGRFSTIAGVMLETLPGSVTYGGTTYDWTKLPTGTTGTARVYAVVSIP